MRIKTISQIDKELDDLGKKESELESKITRLEEKRQELISLKREPLGPSCPFCGDAFESLKGLKIHIKLKAKYETNGPHRDAVLYNKIDYTESGKVRVECDGCGDKIILNSNRRDRRIREENGILCVHCRRLKNE